jgi:6-phosphogluconolactonase/glucosamine-6-phosphate isomerase/deaminase
MEVNDDDLDGAARRYALKLPDHLDVVHLGLGPDGHCASLVPNDPVLEVTDRLVALSNPYQGTRRMTLTFPALANADQLLWLVSGEDKHDALEKLLDGDTSIPAGRVDAGASLVLCDRRALRP